MSEPKFSIGEAVIVLWDNEAPEACTIHSVTDKKVGGQWGYRFEEYSLHMTYAKAWVSEAIIRKRPPLYGTFDQMMDELTRPVGVPSNAD